MKKLILSILIIQLLFATACSDTSKQEKPREELKVSEIQTKSHGQKDKTDSLIKSYRGSAEKEPNNHSNYTRLAEAYIQKARETGDVSYYSKAEKTLNKALELNPESYATLIYLGQVSSAKHDFLGTAEYAKKAVAIRPGESSSYGLLGDAYIELGKYDEAEEAYKKMLSIQKSLYSYSRISHIRELRGDVRGAIEAMEKAINAGKKQKLPSENIAWAHSILAELYFNEGDLRSAQEQYEASLKTYSDYYYSLAGLAKVKAAEGKYEESIELYEKAINLVPKPAFVESLGNVYKKIGNQTKAKEQYDLAENMVIAENQKHSHNWERALLYTNRNLKLDEALHIAKHNFEKRKDIYTYDILAWTLYKNDKLGDALDASLKSHKLGTKDAKLFFHTSMIYYKLGELDKAKQYLTKALSINPHFHLIHSEVAERTLEEIESKLQSANK